MVYYYNFCNPIWIIILQGMKMKMNSDQILFYELYGCDEADFGKYKERLNTLVRLFQSKFTETDIHLFSVPGRVEISGNHTDHNHGHVLAAGISLDSVAAASACREDRITLYSDKYPEPFIIDLSDLKMNEKEKGTSHALIRGIASRLRETGFSIGGFNAVMFSDVPAGSGLSASASFEVLVASIFNTLYNKGTISPEETARISRYAENTYFGKPCGLMDQTACAVGGMIHIDFLEPEKPMIKKVPFDFLKSDCRLLVVDTGGNHEDLTDQYSAVPEEMRRIAELLGKSVCREIDRGDLIQEIIPLRNNAGDRAILRAMHFLAENERVLKQVSALEKNNLNAFLELVNASGQSSWKLLQNIYCPENTAVQSIALALALTEDFIQKAGCGACRVHGGGFAGTILAFLPDNNLADYIRLMEHVFKKGSVRELHIRKSGAVYINSCL
jgi:galactokinase